MILKTQDGMTLVNANIYGAFGIVEEAEFVITAFGGDITVKLGRYSTLKQAKEVLDVMQNDLAEGGAVYQLPQDKDLPYECPRCHNTEHLPGAKFCMICGEAFPLSEQRKV